MDHHRKGNHTPKRFLSMRNQRTTSSAASSAETSPHFLSCRQAVTPPRPSVALPGQPPTGQHPATVSSSGGARLREPLPNFGDAIRQSETSTADTVFGGIRKRNVVSRATIINGRPTTLVTRLPVPIAARRLQSEPGAKSKRTAMAVSSSSSSVTGTPDNAPRKKPATRLSPTALDWVPGPSTALSPRFASLSYADVARIGDGRPPPPFPLLRKLNNNPRGRHATSTGTVVRPGANSSIATSGGSGIDIDNDSEMDDGHNSDKENDTTLQEARTTTASIDPLAKKTPDNGPACHGLGDGLADGLGFLGKSADDEGFSIGASDEISVNMNFMANARDERLSYAEPLHQEIAQQKSRQSQPGPQSPDHRALDEAVEKMLKRAKIDRFAASPFLPKTGAQLYELQQEHNREADARKNYQAVQQKKELKRLMWAQPVRPRLPFTARQFPGGKDVQDSQARLGCSPIMQAPFQPVDGSSSVLGRLTTFSDGPEVLGNGVSSHPVWPIAPWPSLDDLVVAGQYISRNLPPPTATLRDQHIAAKYYAGQDNAGQRKTGHFTGLSKIPSGWDWISEDEKAQLIAEPAVDIGMDEIPGPLQRLIEAIDHPETWYKC